MIGNSTSINYSEPLEFNIQLTRAQVAEPDVYQPENPFSISTPQETVTPRVLLVVIDGELCLLDEGSPPNALFLNSSSKLLHIR